jgi:hypothetical protein
VSIESVVSNRVVRWRDLFAAHGYVLGGPISALASGGEVQIRARRPRTYGGPNVAIDIREAWGDGSDPDRLGLNEDDCFLNASSWNAQIAKGEEGTHRLDVDRRKSRGLMIHLHPFGEPNEVRVPAASKMSRRSFSR